MSDSDSTKVTCPRMQPGPWGGRCPVSHLTTRYSLEVKSDYVRVTMCRQAVVAEDAIAMYVEAVEACKREDLFRVLVDARAMDRPTDAAREEYYRATADIYADHVFWGYRPLLFAYLVPPVRPRWTDADGFTQQMARHYGHRAITTESCAEALGFLSVFDFSLFAGPVQKRLASLILRQDRIAPSD